MVETIAISSVDFLGKIPFYAEPCSGIMAVTFSSGSNIMKRITTIDLYNKCTDNFSGTSASAPVASGNLLSHYNKIISYYYWCC